MKKRTSKHGWRATKDTRSKSIDDSKIYRKFRLAVRKRDKICQMPGCNQKCYKKEVHHIIPWAQCPWLRYEPKNGILLCKTCHDSIKSKEAYYIELFGKIVESKYANPD